MCPDPSQPGVGHLRAPKRKQGLDWPAAREAATRRRYSLEFLRVAAHHPAAEVLVSQLTARQPSEGETAE